MSGLGHEGEFGLVRSFLIDDGQLDGLSDAQIFTLGYELCLADGLLKTSEGGSMQVRVENRERIEEGCRKSNRDFRLKWLPADSSESWLELTVEPGKPVNW